MTPFTLRRPRLARLSDSRAARAQDALRPRGEKGKKQAGTGLGGARREAELERLGVDSKYDQGELDAKLWKAVVGKDVEGAKQLLEHGADANSLHQDFHILNYAVDAVHPGLVRLLLEHGADPNWKNPQETTLAGNGQTALHMVSNPKIGTIVTHHESIALLLLEHGADANARDAQGDTPLHVAAKNGTYYLVEALARAGADPTARNYREQRPRQLATKFKDTLDALFAVERKWNETHPPKKHDA